MGAGRGLPLAQHLHKNTMTISRRGFCAGAALLTGAAAAQSGFESLFDGKTLNGWKPQPRNVKKPSLGKWFVQDGMIIGGQDPPRVGSYLVSEKTFADFELQIDARPDWPADTGILVRTVPQGNVGIQVLLDHRPHGGIGAYYGNGLSSFHAYNYAFSAERDKDGRVTRLIPEEPSEPTARMPLDYAAPVDVFLKTWKPGDWNQFRIRSVGALPTLSTWINGVKISELDTSRIKVPGFDPKAVLELIGRSGHIALEVHDNDTRMGDDRWGPGAVCRWRNISIKVL
jgi:hypothetical protein